MAPIPYSETRAVRRGPADAACDMRAGNGWILSRVDATRMGFIEPEPTPFMPEWRRRALADRDRFGYVAIAAIGRGPVL